MTRIGVVLRPDYDNEFQLKAHMSVIKEIYEKPVLVIDTTDGENYQWLLDSAMAHGIQVDLLPQRFRWFKMSFTPSELVVRNSDELYLFGRLSGKFQKTYDLCLELKKPVHHFA